MKNPLSVFKDMDLKTLKSYKVLLFMVVIGDIFGVYWYFELKKLGMAILIVSLVLLGIIVFFEREKTPIKARKPIERRLQTKMTEETKKEEKEKESEEDKDEEEEKEEDPLDMGNIQEEMAKAIPSGEDMRKQVGF